MLNLDSNDATIKLFNSLELEAKTELGNQFCPIFDKFFNLKNTRNLYSSMALGIAPFESLYRTQLAENFAINIAVQNN